VVDWEEKEHERRRGDYHAACEEIRQVWRQRIANPSGVLPGSTLDPAITSRGWVGHVQGFISQSDVLTRGSWKDLAAAIAEAYGLPRGAVLVDNSYTGVGDTVCVWAYRRPGEVDHHRRLPHTVFGQEWAGKEPVPGQLTDLERAELRDWAGKHRQMVELLRQGRDVDMERVVRRYNRMRGAILDALTRANVGEVREMLLEKGLTYATLGNDIAELLEMERPRLR